MPRTITRTVFTFDELSDHAKDKARDWFREGSLEYDTDHDGSFEDAKTCGAILGIEIAARNQRCIVTGSVARPAREWIDRSPAIYYSGFSSQGDGACFEGSYSYAVGASKAIREHAPTDTELHRIADELQELQRKEFYSLTATMKHRGHYSHSGCMGVTINDGRWRLGTNWGAHDEALIQLMRDFADWIYKQLELEYDWRNADAQVDDSILANEYTFDEAGNREG